MDWARSLIIPLMIIELIESMPSRISTKIDFESDEDQALFEKSTLKTTIDGTEVPTSLLVRTIPPSGKPFFLRPHNTHTFARTNRPRQKEIIYARKNMDGQPLIINNIKIIVNGNETLSKRNTVGNASVTSKADEDGNIITDMHQYIITKLQPQIEVDNIPVIDGVRGTESVHEDPSVFYLLDQSHAAQPSLSHRKIPQVQVHYSNIEKDEAWHQGRKYFTPHQHFCRYARNGPQKQ